MSTLADIKKHATTLVHTAVDDNTPDGHFTAMTRILGIPTMYLLKGETDDLHAPIVGRIEIYMEHARCNAYKGFRLKGGRWNGMVTDTKATLHSLAE